MDDEEKYWREFEQVYVHSVYECISSKIEEYEEMAKLGQNNPVKIDQDNSKNLDSTNTTINDLLTSNKAINGSDINNNNNKLRNKKSHQPWPKVKKFLINLEPYSLIADIGCGEGKYLNVNTRSLTIGCDRSICLTKLASYKHQSQTPFLNQNQIIICDNLSLPYRTNLFDAVISIGVIHHFSTHKRRVQAVQELNRILNIGGKVMIYVWAMEQRTRKFNGQDVLVPTLSTSFKKKNQSLIDENKKTSRDISNSSTNTEESNDEALSGNSFENIKRIDKNENNNSNYENQDSSDGIAKDYDKNMKFNDTSNEKSIEIEETKQNIVDNFKSFFINKFSTKKNSLKPQLSLGTNLSDLKKKNSTKSSKWFSSSLSDKYSFDSQNTRHISLARQENIDSSLSNLSNSIERYKQIIEEHKDLLPKNFTIRQFPYSSCQDTFNEEDNELDENKKDNSNSTHFYLNVDPIPNNTETNPKTDSFLSNNKSDLDENKNLDNCNESKLSTHNILINTNEKLSSEHFKFDSINKNKRYYHVFKENELNDLVKESCPDLIIYESYYDHGNWVICAKKELAKLSPSN